jgi:hypothetical protein
MNPDSPKAVDLTSLDNDAIRTALRTLNQALLPNLVTLTPETRKNLAKIGDRSLPFVNKTADYVKTKPEFMPPFVSAEDMQKALASMELLTEYNRIVDQLNQQLGDTLILAGNQAYTAALAYYNSVKMAVKLNQPGAALIYDDLSQRFPQRTSKASKTVLTETTPTFTPKAD